MTRPVLLHINATPALSFQGAEFWGKYVCPTCPMIGHQIPHLGFHWSDEEQGLNLQAVSYPSTALASVTKKKHSTGSLNEN